MVQGETHLSENYVPPLDKWYRHDAYDVDWQGHSAVAFYITDITNVKKQELLRVKGLYQRILHANPDALAMVPLNLTQNTCGEGQSSYARNLLQDKSCTVDDYLSACAKIITASKTQSDSSFHLSRSYLIEQFNHGNAELSIEYPVAEANGESTWIKGTISMVQNPISNDIEAVAYAVNITYQKRLELIMNRITSEDYDFIALIHVVERTIEFVSIKDSEMALVPSTSHNYDEDIAYATSTLSGMEEGAKHLSMLKLDVILKELYENDSYQYSFSIPDVHGQMLRKLIKFIWMDESKTCILQTRTDITSTYLDEQRQLQMLTESMEAVEKASQAKSEFISRISHDIRTPISAIISMTEFAREDINCQEKLLEDIDRIDASNHFLLSLINDILDISKIDSGNIELHPEPYLYSEFIHRVCGMFQPLCKQKGLDFQVETHRDMNCDGALIDKIRINQIVMNLLSNAVKYTPEGGCVTYISNAYPISDSQLQISFTIKDTGIGMSKEFQAHMFDAFSQENSQFQRSLGVGGTGLGLAIVKRIVDLMDGTITVDSAPEKGTAITVSLVLPRIDASAVIPEAQTADSSSKVFLSSCKLLLAEDNPINTEIAIRLLSETGAVIVPVQNGADAVKTFSNSAIGEFSGILMDIQMPIMDGYEATRQIRSLSRPDSQKIPIIAMTADAFSQAQDACKEAGMNEIITKPIHKDLLFVTLKKSCLS